MDYFETYSPVATWMVIRFIMILDIKLKCSKQIDSIIAFPQADIEHGMHISLPAEIVPTDSSKDYILLLRKNLFG